MCVKAEMMNGDITLEAPRQCQRACKVILCNSVCGWYSVYSLPHIGQNLWFMLDSVDDVQSLCENLHPRGVRESVLKEELKKNLDVIVKSVSSTSAQYVVVS